MNIEQLLQQYLLANPPQAARLGPGTQLAPPQLPHAQLSVASNPWEPLPLPEFRGSVGVPLSSGELYASGNLQALPYNAVPNAGFRLGYRGKF